MLGVPDVAIDVYAFLARTNVGTSLTASRDLNGLICGLRNRLPVHRLECSIARKPDVRRVINFLFFQFSAFVICELNFDHGLPENRCNTPSAGRLTDVVTPSN